MKMLGEDSVLEPFGPDDLEIVCGVGGGGMERGDTGSGRRLQ